VKVEKKWLCALAIASTLGLTYFSSVASKTVLAPSEGSALPFYTDADLTPEWLNSENRQRILGKRFPTFTLEDQFGKPVSLNSLSGKITVANFFFTHCSSICPSLTSSMGTVRDTFQGDDRLQLLSHSVLPEYDIPPILKAYAATNNIDGKQWRLLTGKKAEIETVAHQGYLVPKSSVGSSGVIHTELIVLLDGESRVRGIYNGTLRLEIQQLVADVKVLLKSHTSAVFKSNR
jgi:protein SCO1